MAKKKSSTPPAASSNTESAATSASESAASAKTEPSASAKPRKKVGWFRITVMVLFGVVYAWDLFAALSNFIGKLDEIRRINEVRELNNFALIGTPWIPLVANLVLPLVVFGLAVWVARGRNIGVLALTLLAGLGVVASVSLSLIGYVLTVN